MKNRGTITGPKAMAEISKSWRSLSEEERTQYNQEAKDQYGDIYDFLTRNPYAIYTINRYKNSEKRVKRVIRKWDTLTGTEKAIFFKAINND
jgi:hypothetical protein